MPCTQPLVNYASIYSAEAIKAQWRCWELFRWFPNQQVKEVALGTIDLTLPKVKSLWGALLFAEETVLTDLPPRCLEARCSWPGEHIWSVEIAEAFTLPTKETFPWLEEGLWGPHSTLSLSFTWKTIGPLQQLKPAVATWRRERRTLSPSLDLALHCL